MFCLKSSRSIQKNREDKSGEKYFVVEINNECRLPSFSERLDN